MFWEADKTSLEMLTDVNDGDADEEVSFSFSFLLSPFLNPKTNPPSSQMASSLASILSLHTRKFLYYKRLRTFIIVFSCPFTCITSPIATKQDHETNPNPPSLMLRFPFPVRKVTLTLSRFQLRYQNASRTLYSAHKLSLRKCCRSGTFFPQSAKKEVNSTDRRPAANVREDAFLFHSSVQEKTLQFSLPASELVFWGRVGKSDTGRMPMDIRSLERKRPTIKEEYAALGFKFSHAASSSKP